MDTTHAILATDDDQFVDNNVSDSATTLATTMSLFFELQIEVLSQVAHQGHDHAPQFVLPRTTSVLIGRNMNDFSVVWNYVRPVDSVRAATVHQGQRTSGPRTLGLEL